MNLRNDENNFGYEEINEIIPINSHIQEDFVMENDGIALMQQEEDVIKAGHEGNKHQLFGIKDLKIVAAKKASKRKRQRTCSKCHNTGHTQCTCPVYIDNKPCTTSFECSPVDPPMNDSTNSRLSHDVLVRLQPYAYIEGELPEVEYSEEVAKLEKNHRIMDWFPKANW
ncbi:hypothetical protein Cgig2_017300 [Carnegiea gigantea]|uniref:Uncharacterized protein n=1 Tax=Carnegiea gigantea TaxID=171969 RepID=A0A9Q1QJ79_9CARY|nr:hypothetical protein Cgig2_017300 [Carnegiea gigantea]